MRFTAAAGLAALLATLAAASPAEPVADSASVYGLELEIGVERERLLIFVSRPVRYQVVERDERTLELRIEDAALDRSAPVQVTPGIARSVAWVRAREEGGDVVIAITREPGRIPVVSSRGSMIAVDFPGLGAREGAIALQFRDAEIADVVRGISEATGEAFLFDPDLTGRITIVVGDRVSAPEALELLDSALLLLGHAALPTPGGPRRIVPIAAGLSGAPWRPDGIGDSDRLVVTAVRLRAAAAEDLAATLEPWLGQAAFAIPFAPTNSLILAGAESHLQKLLTTIRALDEVARESLLVRRLRNRSAEEMRSMLLDWADGAPGGQPLDVWSIPRSETIVVRAPPRELEEIRRLLERLDRAAAGKGAFHAFPVRDRDAGDLAKVLAGLGAGALAGRDYNVSVDVPTNTLLVRSDPETAGVIAALVEDLDRSPLQIRVEMKVLEVTTPKSLRVGLDAILPFAQPDSSSFNALILDPSASGALTESSSLRGVFVRAPLLIPIVDENGLPSAVLLPRETVLVTADQREIRSRVLMRPELLVTSGEEHVLFVGNVIPIPVARGGETALLTTSQNIERRDVGFRLRVLPTATDTGGVRLEIDLEVSSLLPPLAGEVEQVGPTIRQRHVTTVIQLEGSELAVIGLGEEHTTQHVERGVPWLKDLPLLGWAFRRTDDSETVSRLVLAVSAHVEKTRAQAQEASVRRRLAEESGQRPRRLRGLEAAEQRAAGLTGRAHAQIR